ncbi:Dehydrogenase E1 component [Brevibacterium sp. 239c]|uniref:thiamine pyrophosphate-dependent enzyme n=1 Tax=Brevibacterium sp. 239c TaxID=1965356 RepID=UPI000C6847DD|nr:thiamine pyrophosphate-dependent enzyme [Brevibacterium sp. 239c]SMX78618.1 Dehydrogenase E1 component [Brevibacterium sp. 239c]
MHLFDPAVKFSCSGIVGEGLPVAVGRALSLSRKGLDNIAVAVAGEGAANQGAFHESLNLAVLWKVPVIFVIEDNDWGISVARATSTSVTSNGGGPNLIEVHTLRLWRHFEGDAQGYRPNLKECPASTRSPPTKLS